VFGEHDYIAETNLPEVVRKILEEPESELARALQALDLAELLSLGRSVDLSKLDALLDERDASEEAFKDSEDFWRHLLNAKRMGRLSADRIARGASAGAGVHRWEGDRERRRRRARLPGPERAHGHRLLRRDQDPGRGPLRTGIPAPGHTPGREVVGGVVQGLGYRDTFLHELRDLRGTKETFQAYNPRCYLVVGRLAALTGEAKKRLRVVPDGAVRPPDRQLRRGPGGPAKPQ
jgi:hypothetical protein